ncbi:hypothetical protein [Caldisphaera lagunensis]|uniref:hypothetical protein n=1 Tax=Caldisphaera lagunensis TaxID=200415 RepID=UPI000662B495|nr:hypothetical protein [Caldisphaera lagunensis]
MGCGRNFGWYPGNGPFNYLPPWERPGYYMRYGIQNVGFVPPFAYGISLSKEERISYLQTIKNNLEIAKTNIEKEIQDINNIIENLKKS